MGVDCGVHKGCGDDRLRILLQQDEHSAAFTEAAKHVEQCPACQQRLEELAADGPLAKDWKALLAEGAPSGFSAGHPPGGGDGNDATLGGFSLDLRMAQNGPHVGTLRRLGRFEVEKVIGSGGMGVVLKARDTELNRPVAIKVPAPHLVRNGTARQRFAREGRAAAAVMHENVVAIYNVETAGETPYLVMQYVDGQSLQARVDERGPLGVGEILRIGIQAASGLAAAHAQGLVHRDVKPSNILLEGDLERVLLTDFGLARATDDVSLTRSGMLAGTPSFMSPEQARGQTVDARSDLFSLGASLYFAATGQPPFRAEGWVGVVHRLCHERQRPVSEVNPEIPLEVSRTIDRLLRKRPRQRFKGAGVLRGVLEDLLVRSQRPGRLMPRWEWRGAAAGKRWLGLAAASVGLALVTGVGFFLTRPGNNNSHGRVPALSVVHGKRFLGTSAARGGAVTEEKRPSAWNAALNAELARDQTNLSRALDQLERENTPTFTTTPSRASDWDRQVKSIKTALTGLERGWWQDEEQWKARYPARAEKSP